MRWRGSINSFCQWLQAPTPVQFDSVTSFNDAMDLLWAIGLALFVFHAFLLWRWRSIRQLSRVPPVTTKIRTIATVANVDGMGSRKRMAFEYTPPGGTGGPIVGSAPVRTLARFETVVGQTIKVHVDPHNPKRVFVPVSGNPWVPGLVGVLLMDAVIAILFATGSLG